MTEYKCLTEKFAVLEKKIKRITKKLDKYGKKWTFKVTGTSIEEIVIHDITNYEDIPMWQFQPSKNVVAMEATSYIFEMEELKLGDYELVAVIEHGIAKNEDGEDLNLIHILKEDVIIPIAYRTAKSYCEHCNTQRQRNKTVLLQDKQGNLKQVGTTCLKEYTGIDAESIVNLYKEVSDIWLDNSYMMLDEDEVKSFGKSGRYIESDYYLINCIDLINKKGYIKDVTKQEAWVNSTNVKFTPSEESITIARTVIEYFKSKEFPESDNFLNNIKMCLINPYTKTSGFIAYAYIAYQKELENEAKRANEKVSEHQGNINDKIVRDLMISNSFNYDTMYGTKTIYIFKDEQGNVFKWNTAGYISNAQISTIVTVKGTIKGHEVYNGIKQTELTRCKILGIIK